MTKDEVKNTIMLELEKNGIKAEQVTEDSISIERGHKGFRIYFYNLSFSVSAGFIMKKYDWTGLARLSFFYEDTEKIWVDSRILFIRPSTKSFITFHMEDEDEDN